MLALMSSLSQLRALRAVDFNEINLTDGYMTEGVLQKIRQRKLDSIPKNGLLSPLISKIVSFKESVKRYTPAHEQCNNWISPLA